MKFHKADIIVTRALTIRVHKKKETKNLSLPKSLYWNL